MRAQFRKTQATVTTQARNGRRLVRELALSERPRAMHSPTVENPTALPAKSSVAARETEKPS